MDMVTDEKDVSIFVVEDGDVIVENLSYPKYVKEGDQLSITYNIKNTRDDITSCYTSIEDENGTEVNRWDGNLNQNETHDVNFTVTASSNLVLKIKAGYTDA